VGKWLALRTTGSPRYHRTKTLPCLFGSCGSARLSNDREFLNFATFFLLCFGLSPPPLSICRVPIQYILDTSVKLCFWSETFCTKHPSSVIQPHYRGTITVAKLNYFGGSFNKFLRSWEDVRTVRWGWRKGSLRHKKQYGDKTEDPTHAL